MNNRLKISSVLAILGLLLSLNSQALNPANRKDTLIVYETVVVYDTLFVHDTIRVPACRKINSKQPEIKILLLDNMGGKARLKTISVDSTATLAESGIILNENHKNGKSMKKLTFLGVVLFAFQNLVMAQTDFGITAGGGTWWAKCNQPAGRSDFSPTLNVGTYLEFPLSGNLLLRGELNYRLLTKDFGYWVNIPDASSSDSIYSGNIPGINYYHDISIPVSICYRIGKYKPYFGAEYSYRMSGNSLDKENHRFGLNVGLTYIISQKISLGLNYHQGLSYNYENLGYLINTQADNLLPPQKYNWKSSWLGVSVYYTLK